MNTTTWVSRIRVFLPRRSGLGQWALTFLTFLLTAKLGQFLFFDLGTAPAYIWPPYGVALAAVFLWGDGMLSAVAAAAFVAAASSGTALPLVLASTLGNTLQAFAGAYMFRFFDFRPNISRLRDTLLLIGASLLVTTIVPSSTFLARTIFGPMIESPGELWRAVWAGGILSVLVLTPLITGFMQERRIRHERMIEYWIVILSVCALAYLLFWKLVPSFGGISLVYALLVPLFWGALRFTPRTTSLSLFLLSVIGLAGAFLNAPPNVPLGQWLFQAELFLEIVAVIFLIVSSAIEDRRTATAELRAHVEQLEHVVTKLGEQDSAKSDFLAILSHELRNPLAPVLSTLELLRLRRNPHEEEAIILAGAEQRLRMMGRLLDDLLDISRVSDKRVKLQKEYISLRDICERSVGSVQPAMEKLGHEFVFSLPAPEVTLCADPLRIEQVLVNVLNNAAKYTPEGGKIELNVETKNSRAYITIRDNGTGIEASMLSRIFEPFIQVSNTKYGTSGVGVGLALAKELVELHDGSIHALSAGLGRGSTFVIEFPAVTAPERPVPAVSPAVPARTVRALTVLVIDDNQAGAEALSRLLSYRGHRTLLAFTGQQGIDLTASEAPDVVLLDIGLPDIEGYEVARRLRASGSQAFIIALTGYGQDEDRKKSLDAGCNGHLTKPVGLSDIETALKSRFGS